METIKNYLDNMFANLPKTDEILKLKSDLLSNMEDKYHELKKDGKSENEAIGVVISEFGNIDELISELGIDYKNEEPVLPTLSKEEVSDFMATQKKVGKLIGLGVFLCILAPAVFLFLSQILKVGISEDASAIIGIVPLLLLVAVAVGIFILSGMISEKYKYLENGFSLPMYLKASMEQEYTAFRPTYIITVIIGVVLCILSPITLLVLSIFGDTASIYGVIVLLLIVAIAVYIFIYWGTIKEGYSKLLRIDDYSKKKEEPRVVQAISAIIWPVATCIFLVSGFVYNKWHIGWIVFPITGVLFGMFSSAYKILKGQDKSKI